MKIYLPYPHVVTTPLVSHHMAAFPSLLYVYHATFDLNRDLITSFWMTRLDQHPLILNATSGS